MIRTYTFWIYALSIDVELDDDEDNSIVEVELSDDEVSEFLNARAKWYGTDEHLLDTDDLDGEEGFLYMRLPKLYKKVFDAIYEQFPQNFGDEVIPRLSQSDVNSGILLEQMYLDAWDRVQSCLKKKDYSKWVMLTPEYVSEWFLNNPNYQMWL